MVSTKPLFFHIGSGKTCLYLHLCKSPPKNKNKIKTIPIQFTAVLSSNTIGNKTPTTIFFSPCNILLYQLKTQMCFYFTFAFVDTIGYV